MDYSARNIKLWSRLGTCGAYGIALGDVVSRRDDVVALVADLRFFSGLDRFAAEHPDSFYNVGIAEQDMVDVAAGMAKEGLVPFASTYATFAAARSADQVRVSMAYMGLPVKLVGLTAGLSTGILGPTHMGLEDLAIMRSMPNITILSPADCAETCKAVEAAAEIPGPVYIRLTGGMPMPPVYKEDYSFEVGKSIQLSDGSDVAVFATGSMVRNALDAAEALSESGVSASVYDMHTIRPLDTGAIERNLDKRLIVTVEEHGVVGGLGSAVAEFLSNIGATPPLLVLGCAGPYQHAGSYDYLIEQYGLSPRQIADSVNTRLHELGR